MLSSTLFYLLLLSINNIRQMLRIWAFSLFMLVSLASHNKRPVYTHVTFLYDIKRGELQDFRRSFQYYLGFFDQLLGTDSNLIVFGDKNMEEFVWKRRQQHNTVFVHKELKQFKDYWYSNLTEKARQKFLYRREPQFALQYYSLIVFGKLYVMKQAIRHDKWNTDFLVWTDGGILHVFDQDKPHANFIEKFFQSVQPIWYHINMDTSRTYNYQTFREGQFRYIGRGMKGYQQALAGIMGGDIHILKDILSAFEYMLRITLENGDLYSEQSVTSIMAIKYSALTPITSTMRMDIFTHQHEVYQHVRKDHLINPRYFHASIDKEILMSHLANPSRFYTQGNQFPLYTFKKAADTLIIRMKVIFVAVLWVLLIAIFCKNRNLEREIALKPKKKKMIS